MPESHESALPATEVVLWKFDFQTQWIVSPTLIVTFCGLKAKLTRSTSTVVKSVRSSRVSPVGANPARGALRLLRSRRADATSVRSAGVPKSGRDMG